MHGPMNTAGPSGVGETQTATALILGVEEESQRQTMVEHTCAIREEMREGVTPIWVGDDLGRLRQSDGQQTRMATWNVGGRVGTMKTEEKLLAVLDMMTRMRIHLLCVCDGRATQAEVTQALHKCDATRNFKAYGYDGAKVLWLISSGLAVKVLGCLKPSKDKDWISALLLTGKGKIRTLVVGMYGVPGATTSAEASGRQQKRLNWVSQLARKHQGEKHQLVVLGDLNMVPTPTLHIANFFSR